MPNGKSQVANECQISNIEFCYWDFDIDLTFGV
jgi:hypothetical protein